MKQGFQRGWMAVRFGALCALALAAGAPVGAQDPRFFSGLVVDNLSGSPLDNARVTIPALDLQFETRGNGQFLFSGVPGGLFDVRFEAPGYVGVVEQIELAASAFIQVRLDPLAAVLDELLVVAGRRRPVTVNSIEVSQDEPDKTLLELLTEIPGIRVQTGGSVSTGGFIFIRGVSSFRGDMAPVVYVDGVQIDNQQANRGTMHSLEKIPASDVARVRVLKGPDAFPYPMGASNGVILIETNRGEAPDRQN
jgi:outer membrane receptor protein involved in Fe transport